MLQTHFKYIVLGGGISGLTCALELQSQGNEVCLIEKSAITGGVLKSIYKDNCYWDRAAHTIAVDSEVSEFFNKYNVSYLLEEPSAMAKHRQIVVKGEIHNISNHPAKILTSSYLSLNAKWKLIRELFKKPIRIPNPTVREFFEYHFGIEITENIISAVFSGIYSGDINKMEMKSVMANIYKIEQESGSLIRGLIKNKGTFPQRKIYGVNGGMKKLNSGLTSQLNNVETNNAVISIEKVNGVFKVATENGLRTCDRLVSCLPAYSLSNILLKNYDGIRIMLDEIEYNPMVLIHVAYRKQEVFPKLKAFGFLCSQYASPVLKGAIYNSALFPSRSSEDLDTYSIFMKPDVAWLENREVLDEEVNKVLGQFQKLTKINESPIHKKLTIWEKGVPQFNKPYESLKFQIKNEVEKIEGFYLSGSYVSGVSVSDCIKYNVGLASSLS